MVKLQTSIVPTLSGISEECLQEITADGHVFASAAWYRMLEDLDLATMVGGQLDLRFVVVTADDVPIAVCPLMRARGAGIYFLYSLRRYFFEHWIEEAVRMSPQKREHFARLFTGVSRYRRLLEWTGSSLDDCLIVSSPLSYRGHIPVAPSSPVPRPEVYRTIIAELQRHSRRSGLPLWFLCVEGETGRLPRALEASGCSRIFLFYDNQIDLEPFGDFEDYLESFRRTTRRAFRRDLRRTADAGVDFEFVDDLSSRSGLFTELYNQTYSKYGDSFYRHPPEFWASMERCLGSNAEAVIANHAGRTIGFSILLKSDRRGELWTYRIGREPNDPQMDAPYYFGLSFYGPIQRAIELGYRRIWLGPAAYEAKSVRGARQVPLYSYFWFPRRPDRWLLLPFLQLFGKVSRDQIAESVQRPLQLVEPVRTPGSRKREE